MAIDSGLTVYYRFIHNKKVIGVHELQREGYHVHGVVRVPPRRSQELHSVRGSFIHVLQRSVGDVSLQEERQPTRQPQNSSYVSKYSDFTRQFMGALRDASHQRLLPAPIALERAARKEQDYQRMTSALQSTLNRVSSMPVLLRPEFMRPVVDEAEDGVRNDVHQLFGDSAFVSRFPEEPAQREPERFWNRRFELFSFLGSYLQPNQQRQSMIRQLKEVHYGKNNRDNID